MFICEGIIHQLNFCFYFCYLCHVGRTILIKISLVLLKHTLKSVTERTTNEESMNLLHHLPTCVSDENKLVSEVKKIPFLLIVLENNNVVSTYSRC